MPDDAVADLQARVDAAAFAWRQADVFDFDASVYLADLARPLADQTAETSGAGIATIWETAEAVVVVSQTCDVVLPSAERPFLKVSPLATLEDQQEAALARKGNKPNYVHVPARGTSKFACLDQITTLEKAVLLDVARNAGVRDDAEARKFALDVGRHFSRYPLPDELRTMLKDFLDRVRAKHGKGSGEGQGLAALESIRISGVPSWREPEVDVVLTFVRPPRGEDPLSTADWDKYLDQWRRLCKAPVGKLRSIELIAISIDEMSAIAYKSSDVLDFAYLSPPLKVGAA